MALSAALTRAGHPPTSIDSKALVHLQKTDPGWEISSIDLTATAAVPGVSDDEFAQLATQAKETCPLSRALRAVPISLNATLKPA
jgi:osmotically inducible protein OsmC